jgi:hypothetical protein
MLLSDKVFANKYELAVIEFMKRIVLFLARPTRRDLLTERSLPSDDPRGR